MTASLADGERYPTEPGVVPSYAVSELIQEMCQSERDAFTFHWLDESTLTAVPAELRATGQEMITSSVAGQLSDCLRIELTVAGRRTNTYWVQDGRLVATDWNGARSYALSRQVAANLLAALGIANRRR